MQAPRILRLLPTSRMKRLLKAAIAEASARKPIDILIANAGSAESGALREIGQRAVLRA